MIMARSIIFALAVLHFGSDYVKGSDGEWVKDALYQVVRGTKSCDSDSRIEDVESCRAAFRNYARTYYAWSVEEGAMTGGPDAQCRAKWNAVAKKLEVTYEADTGVVSAILVACKKCAPNKQMTDYAPDAESTYQCREAKTEFAAGDEGAPYCAPGHMFDSSRDTKCVEEPTMLCKGGFGPRFRWNASGLRCGDRMEFSGGESFDSDNTHPAGLITTKAMKVKNNVDSYDCFEAARVAGPAIKEWRDASVKRALKNFAKDSEAAATCYVEATDQGYIGGTTVEASGDLKSIMKSCRTVKDASDTEVDTCLRYTSGEWDCVPCTEATFSGVSGWCRRGYAAVWKASNEKECKPVAVPVCDAGYIPFWEEGSAKCYRGVESLVAPAASCPDFHSYTLSAAGEWMCTRDSDDVIVTKKEDIKCYLGRSLNLDDGKYQCAAVDVKCPKGYKKATIEDNTKLECKAEGSSGSVHATASFAAMISVVGAVLLRM